MSAKRLYLYHCHVSNRIAYLVGRVVFTTALAMVSGLLYVSAPYAATQGTLGATSTGSITIQVTKPAYARISNLVDLTVPSWSTGSGDITLTSDVCVYSTRPAGGYTIRATGSGANGAFSLANGSNILPYNIVWNSGGVGALANSGTALVANATSAPLQKAATDSASCQGKVPGPTARLIVRMMNTDLDAIVDGTYSGTLTLLVTPS